MDKLSIDLKAHNRLTGFELAAALREIADEIGLAFMNDEVQETAQDKVVLASGTTTVAWTLETN